MVDYRFHKSVLLINPSGGSTNVDDISDLIDRIKPESHVILWYPWEAFDERFISYLEHDYKINPNHRKDFQYLEDTLIKNNVKLYILVGCDYSDAYINIKTNPIKNVEFLFWPTALLHYTFYGMAQFYGMEPSKLFNRYRPIDKLYLNLNNHERNHRAMLLDYLCKFELFDYGINTWQNKESQGWNFKYFQPRQLTYDDFYDKSADMPQRYFSEKLYNTPNLVDVVGETYPYHSFNHVIPELTKEYMFHTEKTFKSILFGKPFLVLGSRGQNLNLSKYGFTLYGDIFDYGFDEANSIPLRCLGIIDNLYAIKNKDFGKVRDELIGLSMSNIYTATRIAYNDEYIPSQLKTLIKENKDEYKILLRDFDGNYANPFGLPDKWSLTENIFKEIYQ
jgi:hypothetical protein